MQQPPGYPPPPPGSPFGPPGPPGPQYPYGPPPGAHGGAPPPPPQRQGLSTAAIVLIVLVAGIVLVGGGCATCLCIGVRRADRAKEQEDLDKRRARHVRIDELLSAYRANEARADQQYKGRWIIINGGQVDEVRSTYMTVGTGKYLEIPEVQCVLKPDQVGKAASSSKGRRVTLRGKVHGMLLHVMLHECEIL